MPVPGKTNNKRNIPLTFTLLALSGLIFLNIKNNQDHNPDECLYADKNAQIECHQKNVEALLRTEGIDIALDEVSRLAVNDNNFSPLCHDFMHEIGQAAYEEYSDNRPFTVSPKITMCSYGFYHGFMETLWQKTGSYAKAAGFCSNINSQLENKGFDINSECYHGIGHGIVLAHDPKLKGNAAGLAKQALGMCLKVSEKEQHQIECATGVFNGIANDYNSGEFGPVTESDKPLQLCAQQDSLFKGPCYGFMARVLLVATGNNLTDAVDLALGIQEHEYQNNVILNLANIYSAMPKTPEELLIACRGISGKWQGTCFNGIAIGLFQNSGPGENNYQKSLDFCQSETLNSKEQTDCFMSLLPDLYKFYGTAKAKEICGTLNGLNREKCLNYGA